MGHYTNNNYYSCVLFKIENIYKVIYISCEFNFTNMTESLISVRGPPGLKYYYKVFASDGHDPDIFLATLKERFKEYCADVPEIIQTFDCDNSVEALRIYEDKVSAIIDVD